jgi:uncharacterized membrane protein YvlD (DUF360 family)
MKPDTMEQPMKQHTRRWSWVVSMAFLLASLVWAAVLRVSEQPTRPLTIVVTFFVLLFLLGMAAWTLPVNQSPLPLARQLRVAAIRAFLLASFGAAIYAMPWP